MKYCPSCGVGHECIEETSGPSDAVRIAEIERDKAIQLARIERSTARELAAAEVDVAEVQADAEVDAAVAEAEVIGAAIEAGVVEEESAQPVIVDAPPADDEPDAEQLPPVEGSPAPEPARKRSIGLGAW